MVRRNGSSQQYEGNRGQADVCPYYNGNPNSCRNPRCRLLHINHQRSPQNHYSHQNIGNRGNFAPVNSGGGSVFANNGNGGGSRDLHARNSGGSVFASRGANNYNRNDNNFGRPHQFTPTSQQQSPSGSVFAAANRSGVNADYNRGVSPARTTQSMPDNAQNRPSENPFAALRQDMTHNREASSSPSQPRSETLVDTLLRTLGEEVPIWRLSGYGEDLKPSLFVGDISPEEARWNYLQSSSKHSKWWYDLNLQQDTFRAEILSRPAEFIQAVTSGRSYSMFEVDIAKAEQQLKKTEAPTQSLNSSGPARNERSINEESSKFRDIWNAERFEFGKIPVYEPSLEYR